MSVAAAVEQNEDAPEFKMHGEAEHFDVGSRQEYDDQYGYEEYPEQRRCVGKIMGAEPAVLAACEGEKSPQSHYRLRTCGRQRWRRVFCMAMVMWG